MQEQELLYCFICLGGSFVIIMNPTFDVTQWPVSGTGYKHKAGSNILHCIQQSILNQHYSVGKLPLCRTTHVIKNPDLP